MTSPCKYPVNDLLDAQVPSGRSSGNGVIGAVPSGRGFIALLEAYRATGGTAPGDVVGPLLEEHHAGNAVSLAKLIYTGQVFGFEWRTSFWIPMFQFDAGDLSIKPGPQQVRAALPSEWPGWTFAWWFAAPNLLLDGRRPVEEVDAHLAATLMAARSTPLMAYLSQPLLRQTPHMAVHA